MANVCVFLYLTCSCVVKVLKSLVLFQRSVENNTLIIIKYENEEIKIDDKAYNNNKEMFEYGEDDEGVVTDNDGGYEGAIVWKPNATWYLS